VYLVVYHLPLVAPINEVSMLETLQLSTPGLVQHALKQMGSELFAVRQPGI
jgi:hypothetical protein